MKNSRNLIVFIYAFMVLAGGVIGFAKANSIPSLIMGTSFSLALFGGAIGMVRGRSISFYFTMALTAVLAIFFGYRLILTGSFMPAGLMSILSLIVLFTLTQAQRSERVKSR